MAHCRTSTFATIALFAVVTQAVAQDAEATSPAPLTVDPAASLPAGPAPAARATTGAAQPEKDDIPDPYAGVHVSLVGDATVWSSQVGSNTQTNFGGGLQVSAPAFFASLVVKNGRVGSVSGEEKNYGRFLLTPSSAELAVSLQGVWYFSEFFAHRKPDSTSYHRLTERGIRLGAVVMLQAGGADWQERNVPAPTDGTALRTMNIVGMATHLGLAFSYGPSEGCVRYLNCWGLQFAAGYANRTLLGDGRQDKLFRQHVLGFNVEANEDPRPSWHGGFLSLRGGVKDVKIGMDLIFLRGDEKKLTGLTTGQLVPMINVAVPIDLALPAPEKTAKATTEPPTKSGSSASPALAL